MLAGIVCVVLTCTVFQPCASVAHNRARRNSDAGLAIVAQRPRMKREHRIAIYICRNCLLRRRLALHQLLVIVEDRFGDIGAARTPARTDADSQSAEVVERFDREALEHRKVKCRVVHREYDAHRPVPGSTRPVGPVPAPQGEARGDEAEQGFLLFHEHDVLGPSLGHLRGDLDLRCPAQYPRESLAVTVITPPGDPVPMVMERGQFVAWARTGSLEASTEAASPPTKHCAPTTVVTAWRLRAIGGPTAYPIARVLYWY